VAGVKIACDGRRQRRYVFLPLEDVCVSIFFFLWWFMLVLPNARL
jgi:hypothetical protein